MAYRILGKDDSAKKLLNNLLTQKEVKGNKFLYNRVLNEYEILMRKEYLESKPREMRVTITNKCNIGCRYCEIWKVPNWQLPQERMKDIMNNFAYMENMYWLGGETFLYKGFEEILEEGSKYDNLNQTILTNGLLLNERVLEKISKANISLIIAIDAGKKETYEYLRRGSSWETLCKKLELIKEVNKKTNKKIYTIFNAVISKSNYKEMFEMLEMAHKYDFNEIRFMSILGNSDENIWLNDDIVAIKYIEEIMPLVETRAKEYNIRVENKVFGSKYDKNSKKSLKSSEIIGKDALKYKNGYYKNINVKFVKNNNYSLISTNEKTMKCIFPWKQVVIDSKGPMRMCASCNDWLGDSANQTIQEYWNCENMQFFRKKFGEMYSCVHDNSLVDGDPLDPGCVINPNAMCIGI